MPISRPLKSKTHHTSGRPPFERIALLPIVTYRTGSAVLPALGPEPLEIGEPLVSFEFILP